MKYLPVAELKALIMARGEACVSIYLPTHQFGSAIYQDQLKLRNMLRDAESHLLANGWRVPDTATLLAPAYQLLADTLFWREASQGLAIFLAPHQGWHYRLPLAFEEQLVVAHHLHIKPLLPLMCEQPEFYILAISQNSVRLFRGTQYRADEIQMEHWPRNLAEVLQHTTWQKEIQARSGAPVGKGRWSAIFYGSGGTAEIYKDELLQYCRRIDQGLREWLGEKRTPVVLAGVNYIVAMFREVSHYPQLTEEAIIGNPDRISADTLHAKAWNILQPQFHHKQADAIETYYRLANTKHATTDLLKIVREAYQGQVQILFTAVDCEQWGIFDPESQAIYLSPDPTGICDDLLNLAAAQTWLTGGSVYSVPLAEMPATALIAAVFRN